MNYLKHIILFIIISMVLLPSNYVIFGSIPIVITYIFIDKSTLKIFFRKSTYLLFIIIVIIQPILIGEPSHSFYFIKYNQEILSNGMGMFFRAIVIINSISILNHKTDKEKIKQFWKNIGLEEIENVFIKSQELIPELKTKLFDSSKSDEKFSLINKPSAFIAKIIVTFLYKPSNSVQLSKEE